MNDEVKEVVPELGGMAEGLGSITDGMMTVLMDTPALAIVALLIVYLYKAIIVGSIWAFAKFSVDKITETIKFKKTVEIEKEVPFILGRDGQRILISDAVPLVECALREWLHVRDEKSTTTEYKYLSQYLHESDMQKLIKHIKTYKGSSE